MLVSWGRREAERVLAAEAITGPPTRLKPRRRQGAGRYVQGPEVHVLAPDFRAKLHGFARPFSRFARARLEQAGHAVAAEKLRPLQALAGVVYACGPSLEHFRVDPAGLALDGVVVCEYLTFMEVMRRADVQLYT